MSAPAEAVPTLELPSQALMQWSQMALLLAAQLAARRAKLDRLAWSEGEHVRRSRPMTWSSGGGPRSNTAVRAMTAEEIAQWSTSSSDDATGTTAPATAEVAPLNDRWAREITRDEQAGAMPQAAAHAAEGLRHRSV